MDWKKIACTALAVPILYAGSGLSKNVLASDPSPMVPRQQNLEQRAIEEDLTESKNIFSESENCPTKSENEPFYFDEFQFTPIENVYLDGKLRDFASKHPSFSGMWFGFSDILMLPTRLLDKCDWWPDKLGWAWGAGNEAYVQKEVRQLAWNLSMGLRWYFDRDTIMEGGWQHHSFAKTRIDSTEEYMVKNAINLEDAAVRDIAFLKFADKFKLGDKTKVEYFVGRSLWEAYFQDIPASFFDKEKRRPYASTVGGFKTSYSMNSQLDASIKWEGEFSTSRSSPQTFEISFDLFSNSEKEKGASLFYRTTKGSGRDAISVGYHGLRMNGWSTGINLFHKSF